MRVILLLHRYLGIAVGLLMTLWCVSGFVMMYQEYPALTEADRIAGLEPLDFSGCCAEAALEGPDDAPLGAFRIEMLLGDPVLRTSGGRRGSFSAALNLRTGEPVDTLTPEEVLEVAARHGRGLRIDGEPRLLGLVEIDQWTVQTAARNRPVYHIAFDDPRGHEIYVSGSSGEVFQQTSTRTRTLAWLGAIPHWLYPLQLRQNGPLWTQIVIWTSVLGTFLAAVGLYVGIARFKRRGRHGRPGSPYFGWWYWHHVSGLVFGVLTLTWVFSGLMTMNPWGLLSGGGEGGRYAARLTGGSTLGELRELIAALSSDASRFGDLRQIRSAPFDGRLFVHAIRGNGERLRLAANGDEATLTAADVEAAIAALGVPVRELVLLEREDAYYYGRKRTVELPVYRAVLDDADETRLYVAPESGSVRPVGSTGRWSRWIRTGLHGLDFPVLRWRPLWDIVVMLLLAGVTVVCATGTWMAAKRVVFDARRWRRAIARRWRRSAERRVAAAASGRSPAMPDL